MLKVFGVLFVLFGCYEIAAGLLNFKGFGFRSNLKVEQAIQTFGPLGARVFIILFGIFTITAGVLLYFAFFGWLPDKGH